MASGKISRWYPLHRPVIKYAGSNDYYELCSPWKITAYFEPITWLGDRFEIVLNNEYVATHRGWKYRATLKTDDICPNDYGVIQEAIRRSAYGYGTRFYPHGINATHVDVYFDHQSGIWWVERDVDVISYQINIYGSSIIDLDDISDSYSFITTTNYDKVDNGSNWTVTVYYDPYVTAGKIKMYLFGSYNGSGTSIGESDWQNISANNSITATSTDTTEPNSVLIYYDITQTYVKVEVL